MARFCGECGTPLAEDARFCPECGAPVEQPQMQAPAAPESVKPTAAETIVQPAGEPQQNATAPEMPPQEPKVKKPLPKWAVPAGIAVAAVVVVLVAVSLILKSTNTPEKTMEQFLAAMDAGDFNALAEVAAPADSEVVFTEESTAPMFKLYADSVQFRKNLEDCLEDDVDLLEDGDDPNEGMIVDLVAEKRFLHTGYQVVIETCDVDLSSNLVCSVQMDGGKTVELAAEDLSDTASDEWTIYGSDWSLNSWSTGTAYDLLPGYYQLRSTVTTSFGDVFEAETELEVADIYGAYAELYFEYTSLDVYNDGTMDVDLYIGDNPYGTVPAGCDFVISPIRPETEVEARADVGTDEPMSETFQAGEGYYYLSFILCEIEINNDYPMPIQVYCDDELMDEVPGNDRLVVSDIPSGSELKLVLYDEEILEPYTYVCEYEYDYLYPDFELTDTAEADILNAVTAYTDACLEAFNVNDMTTLSTMANTDFRMMLENSKAEADAIASEAGGTFTFTVTRQSEPEYGGYFELWSDTEGRVGVNVYCDIGFLMEATYTHADGTQETDDDEVIPYLGFRMQYEEDGWTVIDRQ